MVEKKEGGRKKCEITKRIINKKEEITWLRKCVEGPRYSERRVNYTQ